ncbi:hypothetical protein METBIDRAFT_45159 [Metschnikowia bicuspidata var. bicuspidata NRRL YB-4993]|uniref:Nuclear condensin complex subunit 3 C-terminal domain-containing protein n=1 Tax=Metschnikowia bicuspidata var. bicuspidata NRRL YB-4993 TaxID=869754 RepID=A0A1A0H7L4_9ASCO|nr:hypothetical protein METBIDRAFT_45159 [Metschnikowia bicuspidata var. bicuspidata NRRL YB-4993]OBA20016.1 hypothetical protein METBIDRAFT_45159 [Metschnikowia bicuspidata var. bicuspidata NRRL YB-4993]
MVSGKPTLSQIAKFTSFDEIQIAMAHIFADAQMTLSGHRKLVMLMRKTQIKAVAIGLEDMFNLQFTKLVSKILNQKKGVSSADRTAKFCSNFVATLAKEESENPTPRHQTKSAADYLLEESISSDFIDNLIRHLLRGIESRLREVRYRVVQLLAYLVNYITEIDEQLFVALHFSLNRRLHDKESIVRIQAIVAISRFQNFDEIEEKQITKASDSLIDALNHDDSPEVRRAALLNIVKTPTTTPELFKRARDVNAINRRLVFSRIAKEMPSLLELDSNLRDEILKWGLNDRDESVKQAAISMLSKHWLGQYHDDILEFLESMHVVESEVAHTILELLFEHRPDKFDEVEIPSEIWKELTAEKAFFVRYFFDFCHRKKMYDRIEKYLPELMRLAFLVEQYFKLRQSLLDANLDLSKEYSDHALKKDKYNRLISRGIGEIRDCMRHHTESIDQIELQLQDIKRAQSHRVNERDKFIENSFELEEKYLPLGEQLRDLNFVIEQLLSIIKSSDSADVAGMRRLMPIITNAMTAADLNDRNLKLCVEIIRMGSDDENYFSQLCTEIITDIRDSVLDENDETFVSAQNLFGDDSNNEDNESENGELDGANGELIHDKSNESDDILSESSKRRKVTPLVPPDHLMIQCLTILQHYLEIAEDTRANSHQLDTLIDTLIRPALTNNENSMIRMLGYQTLGLFTLIDEGLGASNLKFFGISASKAHDEDLKILCMKTIFDILSTHGVRILDSEGEDAVDSLSLARLFYSLLKLHDMPKLQATVAEGLCKLFLADLLIDFGKVQSADNDEEEILQEAHLLELLLLSFFHPLNAENQELRQTLAFCIPVYCFSHEKHQLKISSITVECFYRIFKTGSEFEKFGSSLSPTNVLQQLIYWCDPGNVVNITSDALQKSMSHFWQAMKLLQVIEQDTSKNIKKAVLQNLHRLSLSEHLGAEVLRGLLNAIDDTKQLINGNQDKSEFVLDAASERALEKFYVYVDGLLQKAENLPQENESARSRALSILGEAGPALENAANSHHGVDLQAASTLETDRTPVNNVANLVETDLAAIDKMLREDDEIEYDLDA